MNPLNRFSNEAVFRPPHVSQTTTMLLLAWFFGLLGSTIFNNQTWLPWIFSLSAFFLTLAFFFSSWWRSLCLSVSVCALACFISLTAYQQFLASPLLLYHGRQASYVGKVMAPNSGTNERDMYRLSLSKVDGHDLVGMEILLRANILPPPNPGSELSFDCRLDVPYLQGDWPAQRRLLARGALANCFRPESLAYLNANHDQDGLAWRWRSLWLSLVRSNMPAPEADLLNAMTLNARENISRETSALFVESGLVHVLSISGLHMAVIVAALFYLALFLGLRRPQAFWFCLPVLIFFLHLVSWPPSAVRAALMSLALLWAAKEGRLYQGIRALVMAAFLITLSSVWAIYDLGFQLSFLAMFSLLLWSGPSYQEEQSAATWRQALVSGLVATTAVLPLTAKLSGGLYPLSTIFNLLALPFVAPALISALIGILLASIAPMLGPLVFAPTTFFHSAIIFIAGLGGRMDWLIELPPFSALATLAYYSVCLAIYLLYRRQKA